MIIYIRYRIYIIKYFYLDLINNLCIFFISLSESLVKYNIKNIIVF
jgi:hypothetical protein